MLEILFLFWITGKNQKIALENTENPTIFFSTQWLQLGS